MSGRWFPRPSPSAPSSTEGRRNTGQSEELAGFRVEGAIVTTPDEVRLDGEGGIASPTSHMVGVLLTCRTHRARPRRFD